MRDEEFKKYFFRELPQDTYSAVVLLCDRFLEKHLNKALSYDQYLHAYFLLKDFLVQYEILYSLPKSLTDSTSSPYQVAKGIGIFFKTVKRKMNLPQVREQLRYQSQMHSSRQVHADEIQRYQVKDDGLDNSVGELLKSYQHQSRDLTEMVKLAISRPISLEVRAMASSKNNDLRGAQIGSYAETVGGNQEGGTINNYAGSIDEIDRIITFLRDQVQGFSAQHKEEALDVICDIESDIQQTKPDQRRTGRRLKRLIAIATTVGATTAGAAAFSGNLNEFVGNVNELAETIGIPLEHIQLLDSPTTPNP